MKIMGFSCKFSQQNQSIEWQIPLLDGQESKNHYPSLSRSYIYIYIYLPMMPFLFQIAIHIEIQEQLTAARAAMADLVTDKAEKCGGMDDHVWFCIFDDYWWLLMIIDDEWWWVMIMRWILGPIFRQTHGYTLVIKQWTIQQVFFSRQTIYHKGIYQQSLSSAEPQR